LKNKAMFFAMQFPQTRDYFSVLWIEIMTNIFLF
jgi:hypothetical protein